MRWLLGFLWFVCLALAYSIDSDAAPVFSETPLAQVTRIERRFPIDFDACKRDLFGSGSEQGELHNSWGCTYGRMYWIGPYSIESFGVRKAYVVEHAKLGPACDVSLEFASNGFGIFIDPGRLESKQDAEACIDLVAHTPSSGITNPGLQVLDVLDSAVAPGPDVPGDAPLYEDHVIGKVATELEFSYRPEFSDFESKVVFQKGEGHVCKPGIGCISVTTGGSELSMTGGPDAEDFWFSSADFSSPDGPGCRDSFSFDRKSGVLSWTESYLAYSRIFPPLPPGKKKVLKCAKETALGPSIRVFRYESPFQPLSR